MSWSHKRQDSVPLSRLCPWPGAPFPTGVPRLIKRTIFKTKHVTFCPNHLLQCSQFQGLAPHSSRQSSPSPWSL